MSHKFITTYLLNLSLPQKKTKSYTHQFPLVDAHQRRLSTSTLKNLINLISS